MVNIRNGVRLWGCTTPKIGKPSTVFFVSFSEHLKKNFQAGAGCIPPALKHK